jgi:hypothetical protein
MMPLDLAPNPDGNIVLRDGIAHYVSTDDPTPEQRRIAHFATCPNASKHRKANA